MEDLKDSGSRSRPSMPSTPPAPPTGTVPLVIPGRAPGRSADGSGVDTELTGPLRRALEAVAALAGARCATLVTCASDGRPDGLLEVTVGESPGGGADGPDASGGLPSRLVDAHGALRTDDDISSAPPGELPLDPLEDVTLRGVPVHAGGSLVGVLYLGGDCVGCPADGEAGATEALASVAAVAIQAAGLVGRVSRQKQSLEALHGVSTALLAGASEETVRDLVALHAQDLVGADLCTIATLDADEVLLEIRAATGPESAELVGERFRRAGSISGEVIASGRPVRLRELDHDPRSPQPIVQRGGIGPWLSVPLWSEGRPIGTLSVGRADGRPPFGGDDVELLQTFAAQASVAAQYGAVQRRASKVADAFRREVLPPDIAEIDGADIATVFRPGDGDIGGDFYDVFPLRGGAWGVTLGDITGSGPDAAALSSVARHTLRTAARAGRSPSEVIGMLDDALLRREVDERFCSAVFARVRPVGASLRVTLARAGHPYPVVLRSDGQASTVRSPGGLAGVFGQVSVGEETVILDPGDAIVLYTDGVTEARSGAEQLGLDRLVEVLVRRAGQQARVIARSIDEAVAEFAPGPTDDIAVVVLAAPASVS